MSGINEVLCINSDLLSDVSLLLSLVLDALIDLGLDLSKVLSDVLITLLELLLSKLSDSSVDHALLVLEKAGRSTEEAVKRDNLLEESELGVRLSLGSSLLLGNDSLLNGGLDLGVDL